MQKNWYAVYTRPNCEKKVASFLNKKKIENFCPMNTVKLQSLRRNKILLEPLFKSYLFVHFAEEDISLVKKAGGAISVLYWMGKPAIILEDEIQAIKEFVATHREIELERIQVNNNDLKRLANMPAYTIYKEGKMFAIRNKTITVNLPSLGYIMVARIKDESIFARETTILQNNSFLNS